MSQHDVRKRVSVLPVMTDPVSKETYFVLGRNRVVHDWSDGSATWSDFGGQCNEDEEREQCAARELVEESLETILKLSDAVLFAQALREDVYMLCLETESALVYLVRFQWNPACSYEFSSFRSVLSCLYKLHRRYPLSKEESNKMLRYGWFDKRKKKLEALLQHPALTVHQTTLRDREILAAQQTLGELLGRRVSTSPRVADSVQQCFVIRDVNSAWLEKDKLQLFSVEQLRAMLSHRTADLVQESFRPVLAKVLTTLCFSACRDSDVCECEMFE